MIKLSVMYPFQPGSRFDVDYYLTKHHDLVQVHWGPFLKGAYVVKGLTGATPDSVPTYQIMAHAEFESLDALSQARAAAGEALRSDIPNFTSVTPIVQVGQVLG